MIIQRITFLKFLFSFLFYSLPCRFKSTFMCNFCKKRDLCSNEECEEIHNYSDYKKYFKNWNISPSGDETEKTMFWAFIMQKYAKELTEHYHCEFPDLPSPWKNITREEAKASLNNLSTAVFDMWHYTLFQKNIICVGNKSKTMKTISRKTCLIYMH